MFQNRFVHVILLTPLWFGTFDTRKITKTTVASATAALRSTGERERENGMRNAVAQHETFKGFVSFYAF